MKSIIASFFFLIYSITSIGATIQSHYCMGDFVGSGMYHSSLKKCSKCGMTKKKSKGCCEDKLQFLQLKREHNQLNNIDFKFNLDATHLLPNSFNQQFLITYSQDNEKNLIAHRPAIHKQRLHLLYRVLLI